MSTFEVFGLVLRTIPILISGAGFLASDKSLVAFRKRQYVNKLANALLLQQQTVRETVRLIITRSGCDHDESLLNEDPLTYFQNKNIQAQVLDFLGDENYKALIGRLQDMQTTLEEVARHLDGVIPTHKDNPYDLAGIIEANLTAKKYRPDFLPRLKVALKSSEIKQSIGELDTATSTLHTFSQTILMNRHEPVNSLPSSNHVKLAKAFRQIHKYSKSLYTALSCCTQTCHSEHEHDAHVLLEDRLDAAAKLLNPKLQWDKESETSLAFQLVFAARFQATWHELSVKCIQEDDNFDSTQTMRPSLVQFIGPKRNESAETNCLAKFAPVNDFCTTIVTAHDKAQHVAFVLHESSRMSIVAAKEKTIMQKNNCQKITLRSVLSGSHNPRAMKLPLRSSMLLASKIASSLLQFSQTRWSGQTWSKDSIYFMLHPTPEGIAPLIDFSRAFAYAKIENSEVDGVNTAEPRSILLELGILLLEIWHQTSLEDQFSDKTADLSGGYFSRLSLAAQWLDDDYNTPPLLYEDAIRYCIYGVSTKKGADWNTNEFWGEICKEVIKPLSENCKQWK
ncbi:uncharacterized protein TrAFT101_008305 [Trichoderma asperellum]|uniref:uncharacterized protein n=1 Tax=Trichoderma asperellum TaxID=101201 RepID=UPI00331C68ED|nr:hypothetical protein TrAFT101_008305 [Trichoderma asperellum]